MSPVKGLDVGLVGPRDINKGKHLKMTPCIFVGGPLLIDFRRRIFYVRLRKCPGILGDSRFWPPRLIFGTVSQNYLYSSGTLCIISFLFFLHIYAARIFQFFSNHKKGFVENGKVSAPQHHHNFWKFNLVKSLKTLLKVQIWVVELR